MPSPVIVNSISDKAIEFRVPSNSRPGKSHRVKLWLETFRGFQQDSLSCECEHWIYQRKPLSEKSCRHTQQVEEFITRESALIQRITGSEVYYNEERVQEEVAKGISRLEALLRDLQPNQTEHQ